jgi:hypothetical protein
MRMVSSNSKERRMSKKSFAEQGLEDISNETAAAEQAVAYTEAPTEGEFVQVGGLEPVKYFYRTSAPKKPTKSAYKIIEKGQTIEGTYERSFVGGKFKNPTYLVRLPNGDLIGLPGAGSLYKAMSKLAEGSKVKITYNGMEAIKSGEWEGTEAHVFTVLGNKLK